MSLFKVKVGEKPDEATAPRLFITPDVMVSEIVDDPDGTTIHVAGHTFIVWGKFDDVLAALDLEQPPAA